MPADNISTENFRKVRSRAKIVWAEDREVDKEADIEDDNGKVFLVAWVDNYTVVLKTNGR